jgi:hypothetical protein
LKSARIVKNGVHMTVCCMNADRADLAILSTRDVAVCSCTRSLAWFTTKRVSDLKSARIVKNGVQVSGSHEDANRADERTRDPEHAGPRGLFVHTQRSMVFDETGLGFKIGPHRRKWRALDWKLHSHMARKLSRISRYRARPATRLGPWKRGDSVFRLIKYQIVIRPAARQTAKIET